MFLHSQHRASYFLMIFPRCFWRIPWTFIFLKVFGQKLVFLSTIEILIKLLPSHLQFFSREWSSSADITLTMFQSWNNRTVVKSSNFQRNIDNFGILAEIGIIRLIMIWVKVLFFRVNLLNIEVPFIFMLFRSLELSLRGKNMLQIFSETIQLQLISLSKHSHMPAI